MKLLTTSLVLAPLAAFAQEATTTPPTLVIPEDLGDSIVSAVVAHPATTATIVAVWLVQVIIKFILATTTTKDVWWYKLLEIAAGFVGKAKQIAPK